MLGLPDSVKPSALQGSRTFPLRVPVSFIKRISPGNPKDPLLLQILPTTEEQNVRDGFTTDPVQDRSAVVVPGLLKKYHARALLIATYACAMNCRFCFRRAYKTDNISISDETLFNALKTIESDPSISEVILSGGDPLVMSRQTFRKVIIRFGRMSHIKRLRIHTRLPVILPENISRSLIKFLANTPMTTFIVLHINHQNEITKSVKNCVKNIRDSGLTVLNQSVLLKGINDDAETLISLSEKLIGMGILPYYLHQLDKVSGAAHFYVDEEKGKRIMNRVRRSLPGYAVPKYVKEVAGEPCKIPIF